MPSCKYFCALANFRIEKKIGQGQFSEVYKATYVLEGQLVALKKVQVLCCFRGIPEYSELRLTRKSYIHTKYIVLRPNTN